MIPVILSFHTSFQRCMFYQPQYCPKRETQKRKIMSTTTDFTLNTDKNVEIVEIQRQKQQIY